MIVTHVDKNPEQLKMTISAELDATPERAWQLWSDPRQLERWWGPPGYPATFTEHDLTPGAHVSYFMTSPEGERHHGWWKVLAVDPPARLELQDGFADSEGKPDPEMPTGVMVVTLTANGGGTLMAVESSFPSIETMEQLLEMGQEEGMIAAMGQIEGILTSVAKPS
jgi:uncharacterized protein YndB with AHSA1/START domain